jgi:hypothetical protein
VAEDSLDELMSNPAMSVDKIAERERCSPRKINMTISLAFLAPDLVKAAIEGRYLMAWVWPVSVTYPPHGGINIGRWGSRFPRI